MGKNQHVVPAGDKWGIKGEGNSRLTSTFDRQSDAIAAARQISKNQHFELLFTVVMDRFEKETLMVRIHFLQEDKSLSILSV